MKKVLIIIFIVLINIIFISLASVSTIKEIKKQIQNENFINNEIKDDEDIFDYEKKEEITEKE